MPVFSIYIIPPQVMYVCLLHLILQHYLGGGVVGGRGRVEERVKGGGNKVLF